VTAELPAWAAAIVDRLEFLASRRPGRQAFTRQLTATVTALEHRIRAPDGRDRLLSDFLHACLDEFAATATGRPDLAEIRSELDDLCSLARCALDSDRDDRPLLHRAQALMELPGAAGWAARVPARVVFLAAVVAQVPTEQGAEATMLVNDLAAVDFNLPLRALQATVRG
jgi:hypothetical protein